MAQAYKLAKEAFVSNLHGGTVADMLLVSMVAPSSVLLWAVLQSRLDFFTPYTLLAGAVDFLLNGSAILFAVTLYSSHPVALNLALLVPAAAIWVLVPAPKQHATKPLKPPAATRTAVSETTSPASETQQALPVKAFVTTYRGTMLVVTCVAILAVDFRVFPRRFGKVENWGTSFMDLGVGSFVFSAGLVGVRPTLKARFAGRSLSLGQRLLAASKSSLPLVVLGLVRLWSVKGLEYAEHVSEYGVHWNFFFTMGLLPPFVAVCDAVFQVIPSYVAISLAIGVIYEIALESTSLTKFMLTAARIDLLSKNREGIFSFFGYLAIFLAGQATGSFVLPAAGVDVPRSRGPEEVQKDSKKSAAKATAKPQASGSVTKDKILQKLVLHAILWATAFFLLTDYRFGANLRVSRRLANLPYFVGVAAFNNGQIALFYLAERCCFGASAAERQQQQPLQRPRASRLLAAFNRNGLALFLLANLATGAVNMLLPTLHMAPAPAMGVLVGYLGLVSAAALVLDSRGISIKLS